MEIARSFGLMVPELILGGSALILLLVVAYGGRSVTRAVFIGSATAIGAALIFTVSTCLLYTSPSPRD